MTAASLAAAALFIALLGISIFRIFRLPLRLRGRLFFLGLRCILLALLAAAFIEPAFVFERLSPPMQPVPVLIDVSRSMRLFSPDSTILPVLTKFEQWNARHSGSGRKFAFYCFGDSLRPLLRNEKPAWSDKRSFLPATMKDRTLRQANAMMVISDGNWSNATLPTENFSDKNVWYLPLPAIRRSPYLEMDLAHFPETLPADSLLVAAIALEGVSAGAGDSIIVKLMERNVCLDRKSEPAPAGFFRRDVAFRIGKRVAGRHLYRLEAQFARSSITCSRWVLHTALPGYFTYSLYNDHPSLDQRFIQLALGRDHDFRGRRSGSTKMIDLLVLMDWDPVARQMALRVKPEGGFCFIGAEPVPFDTLPPSAANAFIPGHGGGNESEPGPMSDLDLARLPPPSHFLRAKGTAVTPDAVVLSAVLPDKKARAGRADTLPVIFTGRWNGHRTIFCAAADIWRWDFQPLALEPAEEKSFAFSWRFVSLVKTMLVNNLAGEMLVYPAGPIVETDSIPLHLLFPADLPTPSDVRLSCTITRNETRFDTACVVTDVNASCQSLRCRPLPAGRYRLDVVGSSAGRHFTFSDSLTVEQDQSEFAVGSQNISLLQQLAQPLSDFSDSSLAATVFSSAPGVNPPLRETIPIRRDWPLLALIFLVLAIEWIARRVVRLD